VPTKWEALIQTPVTPTPQKRNCAKRIALFKKKFFLKKIYAITVTELLLFSK
jgi:hypothetical protein